MVFRRGRGPHFASLHNDPLVVEMKVASAAVRRILIDAGSSMDIITWECLKKLKYPGREIVPLVVFISRRWDEIHRLRISTPGLGLTMIRHVLDVRLGIALLAESIRSQDHQEFSKELRTVSLLDLQGLFRFLYLLPTAFVSGRRIFRLLALCLEIEDSPLQDRNGRSRSDEL
ncbi:hypothetical protein Cgig2_003131 [Carnegiea gigantea]|uniref:Uncharacterized protein n=1 Tax=Carnegiea gigantea TaxID=171969 RepID=A0A9Q1GZL8_9CARY|nr:hypothetical protein Cgig2_003131 [Carnegiea gigantea]